VSVDMDMVGVMAAYSDLMCVYVVDYINDEHQFFKKDTES